MNEPITLPAPAAAVPLSSHWGVIRAHGADAAAFLQGQLTNDVATLGADEARLAGFCSAKGRLQASFVVWRNGTDDVFLACAASLLPATLKRLSMFVLRAKCRLTDASAETPLWGQAGPAAAAGLRLWQRAEVDGAPLIRLPDAAGQQRALRLSVPGPALASLPMATWRWLEVESGVATIQAATVDRFVPQMLNFELLGGIDFRKGCYPGQEVVARSQYRGTLKRRTFLFEVDAAASPADELFHSDDPGQPAGLVVDAAAMPDGAGWSVLAEVKLAALGHGSLHLGAADGPALRQRALPYAVPVGIDEPA